MCEVDCPYKDKCKSYPERCCRCTRNKARKKDYFCPDYWEPCRPYRYRYWKWTDCPTINPCPWTTTTWTTNTALNQDYFVQT